METVMPNMIPYETFIESIHFINSILHDKYFLIGENFHIFINMENSKETLMNSYIAVVTDELPVFNTLDTEKYEVITTINSTGFEEVRLQYGDAHIRIEAFPGIISKLNITRSPEGVSYLEHYMDDIHLQSLQVRMRKIAMKYLSEIDTIIKAFDTLRPIDSNVVDTVLPGHPQDARESILLNLETYGMDFRDIILYNVRKSYLAQCKEYFKSYNGIDLSDFDWNVLFVNISKASTWERQKSKLGSLIK